MQNPEPKLLLSSILSPVVSSFSSSLYSERLFFLHPICHFCKNSTAPPLLLPHVSEIQTPARVLLFLSLLASSLQPPCSVVLSPLKVGEEHLQSDIWAVDWFLLKVVVSLQTTDSNALSGCFTVHILQERFKRCSVGYLVLVGSSFTYGDAKIFLFVSLVFTK